MQIHVFNRLKVISPPPGPCEQGLTHVTPIRIFMPLGPIVNASTPSFPDYVIGEMSALGIRMIGELSTMHDSL